MYAYYKTFFEYIAKMCPLEHIWPYSVMTVPYEHAISPMLVRLCCDAGQAKQ